MHKPLQRIGLTLRVHEAVHHHILGAEFHHLAREHRRQHQHQHPHNTHNVTPQTGISHACGQFVSLSVLINDTRSYNMPADSPLSMRADLAARMHRTVTRRLERGINTPEIGFTAERHYASEFFSSPSHSPFPSHVPNVFSAATIRKLVHGNSTTSIATLFLDGKRERGNRRVCHASHVDQEEKNPSSCVLGDRNRN